jgi:predicted nucleotidyltransferase
MNYRLDDSVARTINEVGQRLKESFPGNFLALILYGSWAKGTARSDSDIDLLALFDAVDGEVSRKIRDIESEIACEREVSVVPAGYKVKRRRSCGV